MMSTPWKSLPISLPNPSPTSTTSGGMRPPVSTSKTVCRSFWVSKPSAIRSPNPSSSPWRDRRRIPRTESAASPRRAAAARKAVRAFRMDSRASTSRPVTIRRSRAARNRSFIVALRTTSTLVDTTQAARVAAARQGSTEQGSVEPGAMQCRLPVIPGFHPGHNG